MSDARRCSGVRTIPGWSELCTKWYLYVGWQLYSAIHVSLSDDPAIASPAVPRDPGLEELLNDDLGAVRGLAGKPMFGGWAWLLNGNLLCGARDDGMLARIGKNNEGWALKIPGVVPMISRGRRMTGWVRAGPDAYGDDALRRKLLDAALAFTESLPSKDPG